jgi:hypothetical protein
MTRMEKAIYLVHRKVGREFRRTGRASAARRVVRDAGSGSGERGDEVKTVDRDQYESANTGWSVENIVFSPDFTPWRSS